MTWTKRGRSARPAPWEAIVATWAAYGSPAALEALGRPLVALDAESPA